MIVAGVTGGIGSGKTTFTQLLAARGAEVIDADELGRRALDPGTQAWHSVVDTFGDEILTAGGLDIDRKGLARVVFGDREKLAALNAIVHPVIVKRIAETLETLSGTDEIVVLDAALIVELGLQDALDMTIVVVSEETTRRDRLTGSRGMSNAEITERIAAQVSPEKLLEQADVVVHNDGPLDQLEQEADRVWAALEKLRAG